MGNFTGRLSLVLDPHGTKLSVVSSTRPWTPGTLQLQVELAGDLPWWFSTYQDYFPDALRCDIHALPSWSWHVAALDCISWELNLPWIPRAVPIEWVCGYRPVKFTISQDGVELGQFTMQRRAHCVNLDHTLGVLEPIR